MRGDKGDRLSRLGIPASKVYLVFLLGLIPVLGSFGAIELKPLELNELGDFLTGAFGPLAIFWLVLGFFQQGSELRNSVSTLELQAKELANSVEQQRKMVQVTHEALEHEREVLGLSIKKTKQSLQPVLEISLRAASRQGPEKYSFRLTIVNAGASVTKFTADLIEDDDSALFVNSVHFKNADALSRDTPNRRRIFNEPLTLVVSFFDRDADAFYQTFELEHIDDNNWPTYVAKLAS